MTCTIDALDNGTPYTVSVTASNDAGTSLASEPSSWVTPSEPPAYVSFTSAQWTQENAAASLTVTRSGNTDTAATVDYAVIGGTATPGEDYALPAGTLSFDAGETSKSISVAVTDDAAAEGLETIVVGLSNPGLNNTTLGPARTTTLNILTSDQQPDSQISSAASSGFIGGNVYEQTASTAQTRRLTARRDQSRTSYVRVSNDGNVKSTFQIRGGAAPSGAAVKYFSGSTNVTRQVRSSAGYSATLAAGATKTLKVTISIAKTASVGSLKTASLTATWAGDGVRSDAVKVAVKVTR